MKSLLKNADNPEKFGKYILLNVLSRECKKLIEKYRCQLSPNDLKNSDKFLDNFKAEEEETDSDKNGGRNHRNESHPSKNNFDSDRYAGGNHPY